MLPHYKIVMVGDASVGKSSLSDRIVAHRFIEKRSPTIGAQFMRVQYPRAAPTCVYELWDCAGQERYRSITPMYYRKANVVIFVYESGSRRSLQATTGLWLEDLLKTSPELPPCILVENKSDLAAPDDSVRVEAERFALEHKMRFVRTSAKTGKGVDELLAIMSELVTDKPLEKKETGFVTLETPVPKSTCGC